jgi:hypothetical protein
MKPNPWLTLKKKQNRWPRNPFRHPIGPEIRRKDPTGDGDEMSNEKGFPGQSGDAMGNSKEFSTQEHTQTTGPGVSSVYEKSLWQESPYIEVHPSTLREYGHLKEASMGSKHDKAGSMWKIDKENKKILREQIKSYVGQIDQQGFFSKYSSGDRVLYDDGIRVVDAQIVQPLEDGSYKIQLSGKNTSIIEVPGEFLFDYEDLF